MKKESYEEFLMLKETLMRHFTGVSCAVKAQGNTWRKPPTGGVAGYNLTPPRGAMGKKQSKPQLSLEELEYYKKRTRFTEKDIKRWYKTFMSNCPNGHLTKEDFLKVYQDFFPFGAAAEYSEHAFRAFDSDNVGYVNFRKFLSAVNITANGTPEEKLAWVFRMYDIDGSGSIEEKELVKIMEAIYQMLGDDAKKLAVITPQERARMIFERLDTNHDLELSMEEFIDACISDKELRKILT